MKLINLDHVAIVVANMEEAIATYAERFGVQPAYRGVWEPGRADEVFIPLGGSFLQLLSPLGADGQVADMLESMGGGVHHIAYAVPSIDIALDSLEADGDVSSRPEIWTDSRQARTVVLDLDRPGGTLIELVQPSL